LVKLRAKCKCGAEFEGSAFVSSMGVAFNAWQAIHNVRCYGVTGWDTDDEGKLIVDATPHDRDAEPRTRA
jgi:hypothetical protein